MAGEIIGKIYEAILQVVLWRLKAKKVFVGEVFWNQTPEGISVEPDFLLGEDKDHPSHFFFVTHSGSSKNSDMKTWRNIGELCEAKSILTPTPLAINVAFETIWKADLKKLQEGAFDSQLLVDDRPYGPELVSWVHSNAAGIPGTQEEKAEKIKELATSGSKLDGILKKLESDIGACLKTENKELIDLWQLEKVRERGSVPKARNTFIRRGLSKLMVFEDLDLGIRLYSGARVPVASVPLYAMSAGLAKRSIGRAVPTDAEIKDAVKMLSRPQIVGVCVHALREPVFAAMYAQVRGSENVQKMGQYVIDYFDQLTDADELYRRLCTLHANENALVESEYFPAGTPQTVWLFDSIMELIKASQEKSNGFGYAQLAAMVANPEGPAADCPENDRVFLLSPWGYLSEWASRKGTKEIPLGVIKAVACVLAHCLSDVGKATLTKTLTGLTESYVHNLVEAKICTYRLFEPLFVLARSFLPSLVKVSYRTCFAEKAGLGGAAGKTTVAQLGDVIVNWQSAYGGHSNDKRKELCGRAVGLRYTWDAAAKKFKPRPGVKKLVLLLDGTWTQKDLNALVAAGWDEIYYPDEIDKLKASVLGTSKKRLPVKPSYEDDELLEAAEGDGQEVRRYGRK